MAFLGLGVFFGGVIVGIPVVTGVAEGVSHQKKQNEEAANETRMVKFYIDCECEDDEKNEGLKHELDDTMLVFYKDRVSFLFHITSLLIEVSGIRTRRGGMI